MIFAVSRLVNGWLGRGRGFHKLLTETDGKVTVSTFPWRNR